MKISPNRPFRSVYSLYQHQYLGYLFESFVVELNDQGQLTLKYQNISSLNAKEFAHGLDKVDFELIGLMDSIQQDAVIKRFNTKKLPVGKFFEQVFEQKRDETMIEVIEAYLDKRMSQIVELIFRHEKSVFEMGNDGEPTHRGITLQHEQTEIKFEFQRHASGTDYLPSVYHKGRRLFFKNQGAILICDRPTYLLLKGNLYRFDERVDSAKIRPFLQKNHIAIPRSMEDKYYRKFIAGLLENFEVEARGFQIIQGEYPPKIRLVITELKPVVNLTLFGQEAGSNTAAPEASEMSLHLAFEYGKFSFSTHQAGVYFVKMEKNGEDYIFYKIKRDIEAENAAHQLFKSLGMPLANKIVMEKSRVFAFVNDHVHQLQELGILIDQIGASGKKYFVGISTINIKINENQDWFDLHAIVKFGDFEVPFSKIRQLILANKKEFTLPNGEIAVIPETWFTKYSDLFHFSENKEGSTRLNKYHFELVQSLKDGQLAEVTMSEKLQQLRYLEHIDDYDLPANFLGELRPYQKAGYNWLRFLNEYRFGGCLADDMGLGKTVQTLAMLVHEKEKKLGHASLLVMPTSLIYNWEKEAMKFAPSLKIYTYTGGSRNKNVQIFDHYDLILTSYGIARIDADLLAQYFFNYVILDESQVIKNPHSIITQSVKKIRSRHKLILTGTPIENTTLDLWSQMQFINPGLLGSQAFFKNEFQVPIERKSDQQKAIKLQALIKPFILRRHKSQVAHDLPKKSESIHYSFMTPAQEEEYEKTKSYFRNQILEQIEEKGVNRSQMLLLRGLTILRQLANHPRMVDAHYSDSSGKMEDVIYMLETILEEKHKILIFSQFVKHLHLLQAHLVEKNIRFAYIDGSTKDRKREVENFQEDPTLQVFLISLKAGGLGLNLTAADYVFILDPWWNPAIEAQAIDRAHRIGQQNNVFIYKFITKNTVEEKILALQQNKLELAQQLIKVEESFMKSLTKEDIEALLA